MIGSISLYMNYGTEDSAFRIGNVPPGVAELILKGQVKFEPVFLIDPPTGRMILKEIYLVPTVRLDDNSRGKL